MGARRRAAHGTHRPRSHPGDARADRALARGSGAPLMWPFDRGGGVLALYVATLALHAVFIGYVVAGTAYAVVQALRRADDPLAATVRDRLPFMLGCGITAGVAPLLFI